MMVATHRTPTISISQQLLDDALALLGRFGPTDEGFQAIGGLLRSLARRPEIAGLIAAQEPYAAIFSSLVLAEHDFGPALMLRRIPSGRATPEAKGLTWGIACVVKGRNRFSTWRRQFFDGELIRVGEVDLTPGDFVYFHEPPRDLHSEQGISGPAWEIVLYGRNPAVQRRNTGEEMTDRLELAS
jgi:hypothetical protein